MFKSDEQILLSRVIHSILHRKMLPVKEKKKITDMQ